MHFRIFLPKEGQPLGSTLGTFLQPRWSPVIIMVSNYWSLKPSYTEKPPEDCERYKIDDNSKIQKVSFRGLFPLKFIIKRQSVFKNFRLRGRLSPWYLITFN